MKKALFIALTAIAMTSCGGAKQFITSSTTSSSSEFDSWNETEETSFYETLSGNNKNRSATYYSDAKTGRFGVKLETTTSVADLNISSQKISFTYDLSAENTDQARKAAVNAATFKALKAYNADVLVEPTYEINVEKDMIIKVVVTGYPASYVNFRTANAQDIELVKAGAPAPRVVKKQKPSMPEPSKEE